MWADLCSAAREAASHAYAPYSNFRVGAAVLADGRVFKGANMENATLPAGVCAERVALSAARIAGAGPATGLALYFPDVAKGSPVSMMVPCGICRQWLAELAPDCRIWICQIGVSFAVPELLPNAFSLRRDDG
ncbi:hypothetical protein GCM10023094_04710 [Rhodococcus olei]|uniref:CMP/dCMP-type deaminase domain-containing protein n=1 Tax=Rhodococcus olei TaxID=2161675 RepID=A0ABP8NW58_9NOCA